ncbi:hypothetical protein IAR55_001673 [Kwoniella newhampshirensis]|uniref:Uncharacterized protein n=1 Tax=Kwoniella newhampshirensis TaxID=1651941 RepID=A0AAW0Z2T3_9TREE
MVFHLDPIVVAAIAIGLFALLLLVSSIMYRLLQRHRLSGGRAGSDYGAQHRPPQDRRISFTTGPGYYHQDGRHAKGGAVKTPISSSSSMGDSLTPSTAHTTLKTPNTTTGIPVPASMDGGGKRLKKRTGETITQRESQEMVVITYEEGLRRLGISQPPNPGIAQQHQQSHHIPYQESESDHDPYSGMEHRDQNMDGDQNGGIVLDRSSSALGQDEWEIHARYKMSWDRIEGSGSPRSKTGRLVDNHNVNSQVEPGGKVSNPLESTWLPSYYQRPSEGDIDEDEGRRGGR